MTVFGKILRASCFVLAVSVTAAGGANAEAVLQAPSISTDIVVDGNIKDWAGIKSATVSLHGDAGVESVEIRWAVRDDMIYMLAVWEDDTKDVLHKPYKWSDDEKAYKMTKEKEDRFAVSLLKSGKFSHDKTSGAEFEADVWHWKAGRSNPAGVAHDKWWKISKTEFDGAEEFDTPTGGVVYIARKSDKGDRLYKPVKYSARQDDMMLRYEVNMAPTGSIADVKAMGVWADGQWFLEIARKLDTGNGDDAIIPANGEIAIALAAFDSVDADAHSVSGVLTLRIGDLAN